MHYGTSKKFGLEFLWKRSATKLFFSSYDLVYVAMYTAMDSIWKVGNINI